MSLRYAQVHELTRSVGQLGGVITAMRGIAAARARQCQRQLENVRAYADNVGFAISQVLAAAPETGAADVSHHAQSSQDLAVIAFCAEHGFAGAFSERVLQEAGDTNGVGALLVVGSRGVRLARSRKLATDWTAPMASHLANAASLADRLGARLSHCLHGGRIRRVDMIYCKPQSNRQPDVVRHSLLPLDFSRFATGDVQQLPLMNLNPAALLERLTGEYMFAQLNEAIVYSYAAENTARLQTMTAARENIADHLGSLTREERQARQEEITSEIVELSTGTLAFNDEQSS